MHICMCVVIAIWYHNGGGYPYHFSKTAVHATNVFYRNGNIGYFTLSIHSKHACNHTTHFAQNCKKCLSSAGMCVNV